MHLYPHHGASPTIHPDAWIAPTATLIGDVTLEQGASVWYGAVLRGDVCSISIGPYSNVQDNTVIHVEHAHSGLPCTPTILGSYVTVGHACIIHGCRIDDRVLVGMGAVVMNGAHVNSDSILGARTLVPEGRDIPSRSLVIGIPGKVARNLTEEEVAAVMISANAYTEFAQGYAALASQIR